MSANQHPTDSECFLFARCWQGFHEPWPFDRLNALPEKENQAEIEKHKATFVAENTGRIEEHVASRRQELRRKFITQQTMKSSVPGRRSHRPGALSEREIEKQLDEQRDAMVAELGGWASQRTPFAPSRRLWLMKCDDPELARRVAAQMQKRVQDCKASAWLICEDLNPKFGVVSAADLPQETVDEITITLADTRTIDPCHPAGSTEGIRRLLMDEARKTLSVLSGQMDVPSGVSPNPPQSATGPDEPAKSSSLTIDSIKRQLSDQLQELQARLSEASADASFMQLSVPAIQAAPLAAILGFSKPPVEFVVIRAPERHPLLDAHPEYDCVTALRVNDPSALTYSQADLSANANEPDHTGALSRIELPAPAILSRMRSNLESWRRTVDRLVPEDIHHRLPGDDPPRSPQMFLFVEALQQQLDGPLSDDLTNPASAIKEVAQHCEEMAKQYAQQHPLVAAVQPSQNGPSGSDPPSASADKAEPPDKLSNIKAAKLYAQLSDGRPNIPWMGRKLKALKLPHWTERSVVDLHLSIKAKKKKAHAAPKGGRYQCSTCNQRCPRQLGAYKQCYECLMKRHSADTTPL